MYSLLKFVPKSYASWLFGRLVHLPLPRPIARRSVGWFARTFDIDTAAAARPLEEYGSIGEFFIRDLKEGMRPIGGGFVSPVDGVLRSFGSVANGTLEQVKGRTYALDAFLGEKEVTRYADATFLNLYLSPRDYHHVHSPVKGRVVKSVHIPGHLWPVNDWSMANIENLFAVNERIITYIESEKFGLIALVMVGATNVGKMSVVYDAFITNTTFGKKEIETRAYEKPYELQAGSRLGTFHMGSTVVMLVERRYLTPDRIVAESPSKVVYGQALVR